MITAATDMTPSKSKTDSNAIWIVQQQFYYYSDDYCASAQDPDGWFRTKGAAVKFCGQKNLAVIREYVKDNKDDLEADDPALVFLALPEEKQLKRIAASGFDPESELGIDSDWHLDWYEVVKLKLLEKDE